MNRRQFATRVLGLGTLALAGSRAWSAPEPRKGALKITDVKTIPVDRYLFVQVHTNQGLSGLGESGAWGFLEASEKAVETFKRYLVGQDPLRIEHHWQYLYRWTHFSGAAIMGALSAIDIALWDIAGKYFGVPCYQLLGGKCRHKARVYYDVFGDTTEKLVQGCIDAKKQFATLLQRGAAQYIRPDVCLCGGLTNAKKIAALAEAYYAQVVPHNPLSPVSTAACVQLAAGIPNFALQEYPQGENRPPKTEIVKSTLKLDKGYLLVPDAPGLGVELAEDAQERHPYKPQGVQTRLNEDGSVVDQ